VVDIINSRKGTVGEEIRCVPHTGIYMTEFRRRFNPKPGI